AKAGTDAQALAKHLSDHDDIDDALKAYNVERQPIGNHIVMHGRKLGTHLGVNLKTDEDRRMHDLLQNDGAMLDWIPVPNFLYAYKGATCPSPTMHATCASSATPIRAAGPTVCRSWCIVALLTWVTCSRRASRSSTCATRKIRAR